MDRSFLDQPHLSISARSTDPELARIHAAVQRKVLVDGRGELELALGQLLALAPDAPRPKTLDLIGHATPDASLLDLAGWVIDRKSPTVTAFFRELADHDVLPRLGVTALRLVGCGTATTQRGRDTILALADILGVEVLGTTSLVHAGHFGEGGFDPAWSFLFVGARDLAFPTPAAPTTAPARAFDLDALPAIPLIVHTTAWPRRVATRDEARKVLTLVRRDAGAPMPGLLARPLCELALPSARPGLYHVVELLLEGQFVRVYPEANGPGLLYPIKDPAALLALIEPMPRS